MKIKHLVIGGAALFALFAVSRTASAAPRAASAGGGSMPYFPGEKKLADQLTNWSPELYDRLGSLFLQRPVQPPSGSSRPDSLDRVPVRDVYAPVLPDTPHYVSEILIMPEWT